MGTDRSRMLLLGEWTPTPCEWRKARCDSNLMAPKGVYESMYRAWVDRAQLQRRRGGWTETHARRRRDRQCKMVIS